MIVCAHFCLPLKAVYLQVTLKAVYLQVTLKAVYRSWLFTAQGCLPLMAVYRSRL
jgi:hypothetical protein